MPEQARGKLEVEMGPSVAVWPHRVRGEVDVVEMVWYVTRTETCLFPWTFRIFLRPFWETKGLFLYGGLLFDSRFYFCGA